jgi:hypothetical protein
MDLQGEVQEMRREENGQGKKNLRKLSLKKVLKCFVEFVKGMGADAVKFGLEVTHGFVEVGFEASAFLIQFVYGDILEELSRLGELASDFVVWGQGRMFGPAQ